jgi:hypothetical protein
MGHHWSLVHTHDGCEDWADHTPPFNDPDSTSTELVPINDTPPDPCKFERFKLDANGDPKPGRDEDGNGNLIGLHDWCQTSG